MEPKEKAKELVEKYYGLKWRDYESGNSSMSYFAAKQCALFAVDEVENDCILERIYFWDEVKEEIEKL